MDTNRLKRSESPTFGDGLATLVKGPRRPAPAAAAAAADPVAPAAAARVVRGTRRPAPVPLDKFLEGIGPSPLEIEAKNLCSVDFYKKHLTAGSAHAAALASMDAGHPTNTCVRITSTLVANLRIASSNPSGSLVTFDIEEGVTARGGGIFDSISSITVKVVSGKVVHLESSSRRLK